MEFVYTPLYEDIFQEQEPVLGGLVADIPSHVIICLLSYVNSRLNLDTSIENQILLLKEILRRQDLAIQHKIYHNFIDFSKKSRDGCEISILSSLYIKSFIHYELINYRDFSIIDTTPKQELNFFKAYMIIVTRKSNEAGEIYSKERELYEGEFFPIHTWPILLSQVEATSRQDPISSLIRSICFFNYLQYHSRYSEYINNFLQKNGQSSSWEYVISFMNILNFSWEKHHNGQMSFSFSCENKMRLLFDSLCIDSKQYSLEYRDKIENCRLLKAKPLFKSGNDYVVMDWDLIINKIYEGLVFDFFERSGIKEQKQVNSIPNFKQIIGKEITETFTFQRIIEGILKKKYTILNFPKDDSNGEPDAYFRNGNSIVLFEIKDSYFADKVLKSGSYSQIKKEIDKKYNNPRKGVGQLIKQINKLQKSPFEDKNYVELGLKPRNLNIYPVIIYTDIHFGMPGISNYLINEFEQGINNLGSKESFRKIHKLTFLDFNFLINSFNLFKDYEFIKIIDAMHRELEKRRKKHNYKNEVPFLFSYNDNQERIIEALYDIDKNEKLDIKEIMKLLNMTEGLPN
ncbi:MAG: hypothetical protein K8R41_06930 [Bacteroidales bacterium]|nr:hypothetical protein [Bacteroidales bacterium]